jgi:hypothetical protein
MPVGEILCSWMMAALDNTCMPKNKACMGRRQKTYFVGEGVPSQYHKGHADFSANYLAARLNRRVRKGPRFIRILLYYQHNGAIVYDAIALPDECRVSRVVMCLGCNRGNLRTLRLARAICFNNNSV